MTDNTNKEYDATGLSSDEIAVLEGTETETAEDPAKAPESAGTGTVEAEKAETANPAADPARPDGFVPYQALKAERERARQLEQKFQEAQRWQQTIAEKLAEQRAVTAQQQQPQEQIPNRDEDPIGYIEFMDKRLAAIEQERQAVFQQQQHEMQWRAFEADVAREAQVASQEDPTTAEALEFVDRVLAYEWQTLYANQIPFEQYVTMQRRQHSAYARQNGIPIADYVRNVATSRGWAPGVLNAAKTQPADTSQAAAKIDAIASAQSANKTLGKNASGTKSDLTLEDLASMSGAELERLAAKNPELFDRVMNG